MTILATTYPKLESIFSRDVMASYCDYISRFNPGQYLKENVCEWYNTCKLLQKHPNATSGVALEYPFLALFEVLKSEWLDSTLIFGNVDSLSSHLPTESLSWFTTSSHEYATWVPSFELKGRMQIREACREAEQAFNWQYLPASHSMDVVLEELPKLSNEGYITNPPLSELQAMTGQQLQSVPDFKVERVGIGSLKWLQPVNLVAADLDFIRIEHTEVHLTLQQLPTLNCPCRVSLTASQAEGAQERLEQIQCVVDQHHGRLEYIDHATGQFQFEIKHFEINSYNL